jgi:hypothetical protein
VADPVTLYQKCLFPCVKVPHPCPRSHLTSRQLLRDQSVKFAGYIHPHPLVHRVDLRVQTVEGSSATPLSALEAALSDLNQEFTTITHAFKVRPPRLLGVQMCDLGLCLPAS